MVVGHLVFPVIVGVAILFISGYVVSTPAVPAPEDPTQRMLRVEPGDQVLIEVTAYYGAPDGAAFFSTQEERREQLRVGDVPPQFQSSPVTYSVGNTTGLDRAILGKRPGDKFTTSVIEPAARTQGGYGVWEPEQTLPRTVASLPLRVEFNRDTPVQSGRRFNATEYAAYFSEQGHELEPGLVWPCEDPASDEGSEMRLWDCRLLEFDAANDRVVYERVIVDGASYPLEAVAQVDTLGEDPWNFTVRRGSDGQSFQLLLDPPVGATFQLKQDLREPYRAGTYVVLGKEADTLRLRLSRESGANPQLIGQPIQYDIEIIRILRG